PKNKQQNTQEMNRFVVFNHILSSYSVTVLNHVREADNTALTGEHVKTIRKILYQLAQTIRLFQSTGDADEFNEVEVSTPADIDANNIDSAESRLITE